MEMQYGRAVPIGRAETAEGERRRWRFRASTSGVARDGAVIPADEWRTDNYMRHPIVLAAHEYRSLGIGRTTELIRDDDGLVVEIELHRLNAASIEADDILTAGYPLAMSVGFLPARIEWPQKAGEHAIYRDVDLLENSLVAVPSDPGALMEGRLLDAGTDDTRINDLLERVAQLEALLRPAEPVPPAVDIDMARFTRLMSREGVA